MKIMKWLCLSSVLLFGNLSLHAEAYSAQNYASSSQINWVRGYDEAVAQARATSKPVVILFTGSNWCPACMRLEKQVLRNPAFAQAVGDQFVFLKAEFPTSDSSSSPYKSLMNRYQVNAFPTFIVVDSNGRMIQRVDYQSGGVNAYIQALRNAAPR